MSDDLVCTPLALNGRLPGYLTTFVSVDVIQRAADTYGLDPFVLAALLDRESRGGTSKDLDRPGPSGTGDFGLRNPHGKFGSSLPPDGRGWGRGLWQIDYSSPGSPQRAWCDTKLPDGRYQWEDPVANAVKAAELLAHKLSVLQNDYPAAICAYNAGEDNAERVLKNLPPDVSTARRIAALDTITTGGNYVSDVLRRRDAFLRTQPS